MMIRFIDIGKQIAVDETDPDEPRQFAFFNTIDSQFLKFDGEQVWSTWDEFVAAYAAHYAAHYISREADPYVDRELKRFEGLCHPWAKEETK
jgi:hypothetical protein